MTNATKETKVGDIVGIPIACKVTAVVFEKETGHTHIVAIPQHVPSQVNLTFEGTPVVETPAQAEGANN